MTRRDWLWTAILWAPVVVLVIGILYGWFPDGEGT